MYTYSGIVRYSECDARGRLTLPALVNYFQDCSTFHTESIDAGFEHCSGLGFAWFIAAWQIRIGRMPRFAEPVSLETWVRCDKPLLANRSYRMTGEGGEELLRADSLWFPFNIAAGRPMRIPESEKFYLNDAVPFEMPPTQRKLALAGEGEGEEVGSVPVAPHHLDSNGHVNNAQYVSVACDAVYVRDPSFAPREVLVAYKQAAKLGDVLHLRLHAEDGGYGVSLKDAAGREYATVLLRG